MLPSEKLRKIISKTYKMNLEAYSWDKYLQNDIFKVKFLNGYSKESLRNVFKYGYNIGNCLITAYYSATIFDNASICTGEAKLLKGTKNSKNGEHVWLETDTHIIDTTLMIMIPLNTSLALLYIKDATISPIFRPSEFNYSFEEYYRKNFPEQYYLEIYAIEE